MQRPLLQNMGVAHGCCRDLWRSCRLSAAVRMAVGVSSLRVDLVTAEDARVRFKFYLRACSLGHGEESVHFGSFDLTGKTGSLLYMAPEVANSEPYNEKVRVSFPEASLQKLWLAWLKAPAATVLSDSCNEDQCMQVLHVFGHPLATMFRLGYCFRTALLQADVFSFGCIVYEVLCGVITSQLVVGPTGSNLAATIYSAKATAPAALD